MSGPATLRNIIVVSPAGIGVPQMLGWPVLAARSARVAFSWYSDLEVERQRKVSVCVSAEVQRPGIQCA
jgi:hypothetical protein